MKKWQTKSRAFECPLCGKRGAFAWFSHTKKCPAKHNFPESLRYIECLGRNWKDTIQPYNTDGSVNKLFIKVYGTKAYDTLEKQ